MKKGIIFVILALLLSCVLVLVLNQIHLPDAEKQVHLKRHPLVPENVNLMMLFIIIAIGCIFIAFLRKYEVSTPVNALIILLAFMWGILATYNDVILLASSLMMISPSELLFIYAPVLLFHLSFCMDVNIMLKSLPQIAVIGIPVSLTTAVIFGTLSKFVLARDWHIEAAILFGTLSLPIFPLPVTEILKQQATSVKQVSVLLEGEALFAIVIADMSATLMLSGVRGIMKWWYQFLAVPLRMVISGLLTGYVVGWLSRLMIRKMYTSRLSVFILCFGIPFFTYSVSELFLSRSGCISVVVVGLMLGLERTTLPKEIENFLTDLWQATGFIMDMVVCTICAMTVAVHIAHKMLWIHFTLTLMIYLMFYTTRFVSFLLFSPLISRLGYGIDLKNMIVCVWGGLKCPFSLTMVGIFFEKKLSVEIAEQFYFYILGLYFLSIVINGSFTTVILDFLKLQQISVARQINMNNCMKHIFAKRERTIAVLKIDRILADSNWETVIEATTMQHPYQMGIDTDEEDAFFLGYRFTWCGDCQKELLQEPSPKELRDMTRFSSYFPND